MANYIRLPNGAYYEASEGQSPADARREALKLFPEAFGLPKPVEAQPQKAGFSLSDLLTSFGQGAVGSTKALTDVAGAENVASQALEQAGEALQQRLSPARQAELRRQQERTKKAEESGSTWEEIKAAAQNVAEAPLQSTAQALGSFVPYIPTMFLGPAAAALGLGARATAAATTVARAAPSVIGTAQGAGTIKGAIYERVYQAELQDGTPDEQARAKAAAAQDYFGKNIDQILLGGGAGFIAGRFGAERLLTPGAAEAAGRTALRRIGTAAAVDVPTEAFQGGQERLAANLALQREGRDVDTFQGVAGQAAQEGIMGALGAAPVAAVRGPSAAALQAEEEKARREAAAAEEARKTAPEALMALDDSYRAARQQMAALNEAVGAKPKKGSTPEEKAAYAEAVRARDAYNKEEFLPLKREYEARRPLIDALYAEQTAATERQFAGQPEAVRPLPSDIPGAAPFEMVPPVRMMEQYDAARLRFGQLEDQIVAATPEQYAELFPQYQQAKLQLEELGKAVEAKGGTTETLESFTKQLEKERAKFKELQEKGDFEAAKKQADKIAALQLKLPLLQEKQAGLEQRGETRPLFAEEPAQPEEVGVQYVSPTGAPITPFPATAAEAAPLEEVKPSESVTKAQKEVDDAQAALDKVIKAKGELKEQYAAQDRLNKAENALARAQGQTEVLKETDPSYIFSEINAIKTAVQNNDPRMLAALAQDAERRKRKTADEAAQERRRLAEILERRLDLGGAELATRVTFTPEGRVVEKGAGEELRSIKRERANLFNQLFDSKARAEFKNGTNNSVIVDEDGKKIRLQDIYDEQGPAAVEYEVVMRQVAAIRRKIETPQGNAKTSIYQQLIDIAAEHERLKAQLESGIAAPTMGEKVAGARAKFGKGEAPAPRQMDAGERYQLQRKINALDKKFNALITSKVQPLREQIENLYGQLYTTTPVRKASEIEAEKAAKAEAAGRATNKMSRAAATAARIKRGDVRKEAEASEKMLDLAVELGRKEDSYKNFLRTSKKRLDALVARYGADDKAVKEFKLSVRNQMDERAIEAGRKTPEYKATLKEQIEVVREALSQSQQEVPSKRTGAVTKRVSAAPRELRVAGSKMTRQEIEATIREAEANEGGPVYRLRERTGEGVVDAKEAAAAIEKIQKNLPENVNFVYAANPGKIPVKLLKQMQKDGVDPTEAMVQGAVFSDGTVLVVGDQHANLKDLEETVFHELVGHYGIDTLIGIPQLQAYANKTDLYKLAKDLGGDKLLAEMQEVARANRDAGRSEEIQKLQVLRELIAHTEEARVTESFRQKAGRFLKELVGMIRAGLRRMGFTNMAEMSTSDVFYALKRSRQAFANKTIGPYRAADGQIAFRTRRQSSDFGIGRPAGVIDTLMGNMLGLAGRVQFIDQYAALDAAMRKGLSAGQINSLEATNAQYLLRFGQQRSQYANLFLTNGRVALETTKEGGVTKSLYRSTQGVNMVDVAKALNKAKLGNDTEQEDMFTLYLAGKRAKQVGWEKLNFDKPAEMQTKYNEVMRRLEANPTAKAAFKEAADLYQQYNAGLMDFLVETGALSAKKAAELKAITYVPFYRINNNGEVQLMIDKEHPVRISNIKDEPQLKELVGGNTAILPVFTSAAQNTYMITGLGLRNQAVKETAFMLRKLGIASRVAPGKGPTGTDVVRFKKNGEDHYAIIDTDMYGIPAHLIVRGMEGIKTSMPAAVKLMGYPADILRKFVTRNPVYAIRQAVRDPLNAWMTTGTDAIPVLSSFKELGAMVTGRSDVEKKLMETGAISSNVFSGDERDMEKFLSQLSAGKAGWTKAIAKLDAFAMQGDASTRAVVYKDSLAKGMSEQEALLRTLESMNFSRRGVSPSMQWLSTMIPFFNAQIQGLDVLYRAYKGQMPFSEQLKIKQKMLARGMLMAGGTLAYAALMGDDEAYKRAKPEERLGNWFVYVPGIDEPVRVPIPFELGYLFKALPEAIYNMAANDEKASKAMGGWLKLVAQTNPFSLPQAVKPVVEVALGKSFFAGDIESMREKQLMPQERYRENTTELAKLIGSITASETVKKLTGKEGITPIEIDYLIRGYTGGLGIAVVQLANPVLNTEMSAEVAKPALKASKTPFIGGLFQPVEGRGTLDEAYDAMERAKQAKATYNRILERGNRAEALEFAQKYSDDLAAASVSGQIQKYLGELAKQERIVRASPTLTSEQKDERLKRLDQAKVALARRYIAMTQRAS